MSKRLYLKKRKRKIQLVKAMYGRLDIENIETDEIQMWLIQAYIDDKISLPDLVNHATQFQTEEQYREWMRDKANQTIDDICTADVEDPFLTEIELLIRRSRSK